MASKTIEPIRPHANYLTIGALRGVAALLVVAFHAWFTVQERFGGGGPGVLAHGTAGVDIFFVISGFVMVVSSQNLARQDDGWRTFLWRRLIRIIPLYWLLTTAMLAIQALLPSMMHHAPADLGNIIASYLFIPSRDGAGELRPVLAPGWTLTFEMMFYLLFTFCLFMRVSIFKIATPIFVVLAGLALLREDDWPGWTFMFSELPIEFLLGAAVGHFAVRGKFIGTLPALIGLVVAAAAFIGLPPGPIISNAQGVGAVSLRLLTYGVPATIAVASLVALETPARALLPSFVLALGDASYSIYLGHGFVLAAMAAIAIKMGGGHAGAFIAVSTVAAGIGGLLLYFVIEVRMQKTLRRWLLRPAKAAERDVPSLARS